MTLDLAGRTHIGLKRSENQDEVFAKILSTGENPTACLAVADGMGGHEKGREASQTAIRTIQEKLQGRPRPSEELCVELEAEAHKSVGAISMGDQVTGTTLTLALLSGSDCFIGHVGDSRAYCYRKGKLDQITEDQTWEAYARKNSVENNYGKALRQAIGVGSDVVPDVYRVGLLPNDFLVLCSDGLYKMAKIDQIESALRQSAGAKDACERLLKLALEGGGKDNVAVCVARLGKPRASAKRIDLPLVAAVGAAAFVSLLLFLVLTGRI